jgi:hypothetical protein
MRVIIAGSRPPKKFRYRPGAPYRQWCAENQYAVREAVRESKFPEITEVVSGRAAGFDDLGERYATINKIPIKAFPAEWERYGLLAGKMRNRDMGNYADALIAIWDGYSGGTRHMIEFMRELGKPVHVHKISALPEQVRKSLGTNSGGSRSKPSSLAARDGETPNQSDWRGSSAKRGKRRT